jgi:hypothetical protein
MQDTVGHVEVKIDVKDLEYGRIIRTGALCGYRSYVNHTPESPVNKFDPVKSGGRVRGYDG